MSVSFGDNVRIASTPDTIALGFAGLVGSVYGETTPSVTGVEVIGRLTDDYAINVHFNERGESYWFVPELVEFVDHAPGAVMAIGDKRFIRSLDGEWVADNPATPPDLHT